MYALRHLSHVRSHFQVSFEIPIYAFVTSTIVTLFVGLHDFTQSSSASETTLLASCIVETIYEYLYN